MDQVVSDDAPRYAFGHAADELDRLVNQGRFFGDLTEHLLRLAGLARGMRVLDAGCGAGDVTFLAAKLVGMEGIVIGVDRSPEAIGVARQRAASAGLPHVRFLTRDLVDLTLTEPVDALIGRLVLQHCPDPALVLRRLVTLVKPGGLVVFQEAFVEDKTYSEPICPLYETAIQRIIETLDRFGADPWTGHRLAPIFAAAGLPAPQMILQAWAAREPYAPIAEFAVPMTRALLPLMERTGVATREEVGLETLAERMRGEAEGLEATLITPALIGAWAWHAARRQEGYDGEFRC
jgi:ubiquinone/menaquinone biosynthesis C-methylase UbiE